MAYPCEATTLIGFLVVVAGVETKSGVCIHIAEDYTYKVTS